MLVGVSRVGKTPISLYLASLGWKVANVPLVGGEPPPELFQLHRRRVVGLTIEPDQLLAHRRWRERRLKVSLSGSYSNPLKTARGTGSGRGGCSCRAASRWWTSPTSPSR
ncbi:MAG: kinase/pyrophosphorylase [Chromatiales bacterium]|nr:kinase/pyrophosphorylase [Chromatiales bacterium]